jgi:hypothetical protein
VEFKALADFLGKDLNEQQLKSLIEYCSFKNMKDIKTLDYFQTLNSLNLYEQGSKFFVKGQIGRWKSFFSEELSQKFDTIINKNLKYRKKIEYD